MTYTTRTFACPPCNAKFEAKVSEYEAGICPKCGDTENVERAETAKASLQWDKSWSAD